MELPRQSVVRIRKMGLLTLGGSDYDPDKNDWQIGKGDGEMYISLKRMTDYLKYKNRFIILDKR